MLKRLGAFILDILEVIVFSAAIFLFVYYLIMQPHKIDGPSMLPNLLNREYIFTDKVSYRFNEPARGDIIVFAPPVSAAQRDGKDYIKRIIGLPGEEVSLQDGDVFINGTKLTETYIPTEVVTSGGGFLADGQSIQIPEGHYFVLGDNREFSSDSRAWGFITKDAITGKAWVIYWPLDKFGRIPHAQYSK